MPGNNDFQNFLREKNPQNSAENDKKLSNELIFSVSLIR